METIFEPFRCVSISQGSFLVPKLLRGGIPESMFINSHCPINRPTDSCASQFSAAKMFRPRSQLPSVRRVSSGHPYNASSGHRHQSGQSAPQSYSLYNPNRVQHQEVTDRREEGRYRDSLCQLCSDDSCQIYHHHVSSQAVRDFAKMHQASQLFNCIMCKAEESVLHPPTRKVILTSSTLFNVWTFQELKLHQHVEIESVVGGRIRDLTRALLMLYLKHPEPLRL